MMEEWRPIKAFPDYEVSDHGRVRNVHTGRTLSLNENQTGSVHVALMRDGQQHRRIVARLVATSFVPRKFGPFDTPINLDGNRWNNHKDNLVWRPYWFARKYNRQFREPWPHPIDRPIRNVDTGEVFKNSWEACVYYGLLEKDLVLSIVNLTITWPLHQRFVMED